MGSAQGCPTAVTLAEVSLTEKWQRNAAVTGNLEVRYYLQFGIKKYGPTRVTYAERFLLIYW